MKACALAVAVLACFKLPDEMRADSVSLAPIADTTISERFFDTPQGDLTTLSAGTDGPEGGAGRNRALLAFDIASFIPPKSVVDSVSLKLTVTTATSTTNLWFSLHKVTTNWSEVTATWNDRATPPAPWSVPGGAPPEDFSSSISQSNLITGLGSFTFMSSPNLVADVQDWVNNPESNFGWLLACELEGLERSKRKFGSRESGTNSRPLLTVQFTPPPSLTMSFLPPTNGEFQFQFNAAPDLAYSVLFSDEIGTTNWLVLTNIPPLATPAPVLISDPISLVSNRFYRVRSP